MWENPKRTSGHLGRRRDLWTPQSRNCKRTSGHLKVEILIRPLDTKKNEPSRCPEVGLGILGFIIRTPRRAQEKHAKYIGSPTDLSPHQSRNPNRTSGHLKIENLNGPPDT